MISALQSYKANDINLIVDPTKIPETPPTLKWATDKLNIQLPTTPKTLKSFSTSIKPIQETAQLLQETKELSKCIKAVALLQMALVVAVIAGIILSCTLGGIPGTILGSILGSAALSFLYGIYINNSLNKIIDIERRDPNSVSSEQLKPICPMTVTVVEKDSRRKLAKFTYPKLTLLFFPIYEAFSREERIKKVLERQKDSIDLTKILARLQKENSQLIPNAFNFYKNDSERLFPLFQQKIEELKKNLSVMEQFSERLPFAESELGKHIAGYETAKNELRAIQQFYLQTAQE